MFDLDIVILSLGITMLFVMFIIIGIEIFQHYSRKFNSNYFNKLMESRYKLEGQLELTMRCDCTGIRRDLNHFRNGSLCIWGHHERYFNINFVKNDIKFFQFCYYVNLHENKEDIKQVLNKDNKFNQYFVDVDGLKYSAISAVILSKFVPMIEKRNYINILLTYGFKITIGDETMAQLMIYQQFSSIFKQNIILFLLSEIMPDIKRHTIQNIIDHYNLLS